MRTFFLCTFFILGFLLGFENAAGKIQHAVACDIKVLGHPVREYPCSTVPVVIEVSVELSYWYLQLVSYYPGSGGGGRRWSRRTEAVSYVSTFSVA